MAKQTTKCHYPDCMLCCCEDGNHCQETDAPRRSLVRGIVNGLVLALVIILIVTTLLYLWPNA